MKQRLIDIVLDADIDLSTRKRALKLMTADFKVSKTVEQFLEAFDASR